MMLGMVITEHLNGLAGETFKQGDLLPDGIAIAQGEKGNRHESNIQKRPVTT